MPTYFLDTSARVKRQIAEPGHAWVRALGAPDAGNVIVVAEAAGNPSPIFVCADATLLASAATEGLAVENPNARP